jgi:hypothetical protein
MIGMGWLTRSAEQRGNRSETFYENVGVHLPLPLARLGFLLVDAPLWSAIAVVGTSFLIGEVAALTMVFWGMPAWMSYLAAPLVWLALLVMITSAILIPV